MAEPPKKFAKLKDGVDLAAARGTMLRGNLAVARERTQQIKALNFSQFSNERAITRLPYPALDDVYAGPWPGRLVDFVGRRNLYPDALKHVLTCQQKSDGRVYTGVILTGPSGSGKSCLLRAIACQLIGTLPKKSKVICFWYLHARSSFKLLVQKALLFTYCNECEADDGLVERILQIEDVQGLSNFLEYRILELGEELYVISDGEENLDLSKSPGNERNHRKEGKQWLDVVYNYATFMVKALSPNAEEASSSKSDLLKWEVNELFQKVEVETFLANTVLGRMLKKREERWSDVEFFAGAHPLSLMMLQICCYEYVAAQKQEGPNWMRFFNMVNSASRDLAQDLLQNWICLSDKDNWASVLATFRCGAPFRGIRESLRRQQFTGSCSAADWSFRLGRDFCSQYIETIYMEEEKKDLRLSKLTEYVDMMLKGVHSWAALGWACETFVGEAIEQVGLRIFGFDNKLKPKNVEIIYGSKPINLIETTTELNPGESLYWRPARYTFKYVDGIILYKDKNGEIHFIAVQDTVDPSKHREIEYKFMKKVHIKKWWPAEGIIHLHYAYICPKAAGMPRNFTLKKGQVVFGKKKVDLQYHVHVEEMHKCIPDLATRDYEVLQRLAEVRGNTLLKRFEEKKKQKEDYRMKVLALPNELQKMIHGRKRLS